MSSWYAWRERTRCEDIRACGAHSGTSNTDTKLLSNGLFQKGGVLAQDEVGRNLTDPFDGFLRGKRFLILDRDKKFTTEFRDLLEHAGTDVIRLPHRSPNLNAYVERFVLSIKSECLERTIFFSEQSLRRAVAEFIHHYHGERNHQGLGNALLEAEECVGSPHGKVRCRKRLGGLLSYYHRDAA